MSKYYAVKQGNIPGIYRSWSECQKQINGYSCAIYKSFKTEKEAKEFIADSVESKDERSSENSEKFVNIYTDGSHKKNGGNNYIGIGAYCQYADEVYDLSMECNEEMLKIYKIENDTISNCTAEFLAFATILSILQKYNIPKTINIIFHIDYIGVKNWMDGTWKCNKLYIKKIYEKCKIYMSNIRCSINIKHVKGHSISHGNNMADLRATDEKEYNNFDELFKILASL